MLFPIVMETAFFINTFERMCAEIIAQPLDRSHVILSCGQNEPTNDQLQTAAECAAWYSTGRDDSKVEVDSTMIKHVKKPPHSVPGYVIFDHQTTYVVTPKKHDELSK